MKKILITGASGYIGSCLYYYLRKKFKVLTVDKKKTKYLFINTCDLLNSKKFEAFLKKENPDLIVHLAAQSLVDETINKKKYYLNNIIATKNLIYSMKKNNLNNLIFSSTAALYKFNNRILNEKSKIKPKSTYAKTKYECEKIIKRSELNSVILRFFNVCSSLKKDRKIIGEFHNPETHLIPRALDAASGGPPLEIFGDDYETPDGTCLRDYIHVTDLASAHVLALGCLEEGSDSTAYNLGNGKPYSVKEVVEVVSQVTSKRVPCVVSPQRSGDPAILFASSENIQRELNWTPRFTELTSIVETAWRWHRGKSGKTVVVEK